MTEKKNKIDWLLLIFLLLFTNQAVFSLKIAGLVFICLTRFNWRFDFGKGRLPKFYIYILLLAIFDYLFITREFKADYTVAFIIGNLFWIFSAISSHQVKLSVEQYGPEGVYKTIKVFTVFNFICCIWQLVKIMFITGRLNPYYEMLAFPYGMSTGDNIFGTFMQNSYYNIMVSTILSIYFIFKRNIFFTILSIICFVLVFGNFGTIIFIGILVALFATGVLAALLRAFGRGGWLSRISPPGKFYLYIPLLFFFIATSYYTISPKNFDYIVDKFKDKIFSFKKKEKHNYATMMDEQKPDPLAFDRFPDKFNKQQAARFEKENLQDTVFKSIEPKKKQQAKVLLTRMYIEKLQGKNLSVYETIAYLKSSPVAFLFGAGTTRFSSLTAQKMSGYDSSRLFLYILPKYKSPEYADNHFLLIQEREKSEDKALLSTANWPDSIYNQLFGEYGFIGAMLFLLSYLGFFFRYIKNWSYGFWLMIILLPFAHLNYVFDTLCVMPFFELLMFADIAQTTPKQEPNGA